MDINIIYRSCDKVNAYSGGGRIRPFGSKFEVIEKCFKSLSKSIKHYNNSEISNNNPIKFFLVDDNSSKELLEMFETISKDYNFDITYVPIKGTGNGNSLKTCYTYAKENLDGFMFFIEDDYLMVETTIDECIDTYYNVKNLIDAEVLIHPVDYPDRYHNKYTNMHPSYLFLGKQRHWRNVINTTGTIGMHKDILLKHWDKYEDFTKYGTDPTITEANTINLVYKEHFCISPVPSLAHHYQFEDTLSPLLPLETFDE
jgi:hypothetical protein